MAMRQRQRLARFAWWSTLATIAALTACNSPGDDDEPRRPDPSPTERPNSTASTSVPVSEPPPPSEPPADGTRWQPTKGLTWQWQLDGHVDTSVQADVFDVDLFETPASTVQALHDQGRRAICYFSAGSWEPYRPDSSSFPAQVMGGSVEGWPDERWLDIRQIEVLRPILAARLDLCAEKGFDGVEPDWLDGYKHDTGFPLTAGDQLAFNTMLAELAHERNLAIGLKNDLDQVAELADLYDFAVVEQCAEYDECEALVPFLDRGKAVFHAEYDLAISAFCAESQRLGLSSIRKRVELGAWRETC